MNDEAASRKDDHVRLAAAQQDAGPRRNGFDDVAFVHHALGGIDADHVSLGVEVAGRRWPFPLYANAMTGGTDRTTRLNLDLAVAARETGLPLATGSMSIALDDPDRMVGFRRIREENPDGFLLANIGVERSPDDARRAVDALRADALQVHLNSVQETVMPEGSRAFSGWDASLAAIVEAAEVPVIVKEVGFGLSARTLARLGELGVSAADVSGTGGTDFVRIENARRPGRDYAELIGWGQSTVECLLDLPSRPPALLASGGVRSPLDVTRALALGAQAVGVSGSFLAVLIDEGADGMVRRVREWTERLTELFALLGAATAADLTATDLIIRGATAEYCRARDIDITTFARRSSGTRAGEEHRAR